RGRGGREVQEDLPSRVAARGRFQGALAANALERHEKLGALGEREEGLAALELAAAGAAGERLHPDHVSGGEVEHRLEDRLDVAPRDDVLEQLAAPDFLA